MSRGPAAWTFGRFVWHELLTPDMARSQAFYAEVLGWKYQSFGDGGAPYQLILSGAVPQGGLLAAGAEPQVTQLMGYVSVSDVDAAVRATAASGGEVLVPPVEVPGVGRLAVLADPSGASFSIMRNATGDTPDPGRPLAGRFCWDRLHCPRGALERTRRFYEAVLGWTTERAGDTEVFTARGKPRAALVPEPPEAEMGHWLSCVAVDDLQAAQQRALRMGGELLAAPDATGLALIADNLGTRLGLLSANPAATRPAAPRSGSLPQ